MRIASLALIVATGCGGVGGSTDVDPTLSFADATDVEISRLVSAASASEGFSAQAQLYQFDDPFGDNVDPCPTVVEDFGANTVTITGGCTTMDETTIEGVAIIHNPQGWGELEYNFDDDTVHEFQGFALTFDPNGISRMAWDGTMRSTLGLTELDLDLTTDQIGVAVRSDIYMECGGSTCEHGESGIELIGKGGVLVSGSFAIGGQTLSGSLTLRGVDTVQVTIANNCVAWQLVGTDRSFDCQ
jgi:hypothetical protein